MATVCLLLFQFIQIWWGFQIILPLRNVKRKKPGGVRSGDRGGHDSSSSVAWWALVTDKLLCWKIFWKTYAPITLVYLERYGASQVLTLVDAGHVFCSKVFHCQKCCYYSVYCCLIQHFLVRVGITKCYANSTLRLWWEVIFQNEHTFYSWIHYVWLYAALAQLAWAEA
jgi:hypothetical protein